MEETRAPPSYSDLTHDSNDTATILEDQVIVTLEEVDQAIARNTPQADFSRNDMKTMKRLIEAVLRRNVREQRVLPTELQKEITIAHVITNFNKTKADVQAAASQPSNVSFNASATGEVHILNTTPACKPHPKREQIGVWTTISSDESHSNQILAYADQVPNAIVCMTIWLLITFFVGSPVTLFWTVPALYSIFQVRTEKACTNKLRVLHD